MITIHFKPLEYYISDINEFITFPSKTVNFEYSLIAMAKWESKWQIPFLGSKLNGTDTRLLDFYIMMGDDPTLTVEYFTKETASQLSNYLNDPQTATIIASQNGNSSVVATKIYTSEEIYAMMCANQVPIIFEERNLNRLMTMLRIISINNSPKKKMTKQETMQQNIQLNEQRKKQYNTRG